MAESAVGDESRPMVDCIRLIASASVIENIELRAKIDVLWVDAVSRLDRRNLSQGS